ncbi:hypothetical protein RI367_006261 [Sorochytrium milnesiophthora]
MSAMGAAAFDSHAPQHSPTLHTSGSNGGAAGTTLKKTPFASRKRKISYLSLEKPMLSPTAGEQQQHQETTGAAVETVKSQSLAPSRVLSSSRGKTATSGLPTADFTIPDPETFFNHLFDELPQPSAPIPDRSSAATVLSSASASLDTGAAGADLAHCQPEAAKASVPPDIPPAHPSLAALPLIYPTHAMPGSLPVYMTTLDDIPVYVCELGTSMLADDDFDKDLVHLPSDSTHTPPLSTLRGRKTSRTAHGLVLSGTEPGSPLLATKPPRSPRFPVDLGAAAAAAAGSKKLPTLRSSHLFESLAAPRSDPAKSPRLKATAARGAIAEVDTTRPRPSDSVRSPRPRRVSDAVEANTRHYSSKSPAEPPPSYILMRRADTQYVNATTLLEAGGITTEAERSIVLSLERGRIRIRGRNAGATSELSLDGTWYNWRLEQKWLSVFLSEDLPQYFPQSVASDEEQDGDHSPKQQGFGMAVDTDNGVTGNLAHRRQISHQSRQRLSLTASDALTFSEPFGLATLSPSTVPTTGVLMHFGALTEAPQINHFAQQPQAQPAPELRMPPSGSFSSAAPAAATAGQKRMRRTAKPRVVGVPDPQSFFADAHARKLKKKEGMARDKKRQRQDDETKPAAKVAEAVADFRPEAALQSPPAATVAPTINVDDDETESETEDEADRKSTVDDTAQVQAPKPDDRAAVSKRRQSGVAKQTASTAAAATTNRQMLLHPQIFASSAPALAAPQAHSDTSSSDNDDSDDSEEEEDDDDEEDGNDSSADDNHHRPASVQEQAMALFGPSTRAKDKNPTQHVMYTVGRGNGRRSLTVPDMPAVVPNTRARPRTKTQPAAAGDQAPAASSRRGRRTRSFEIGTVLQAMEIAGDDVSGLESRDIDADFTPGQGRRKSQRKRTAPAGLAQQFISSEDVGVDSSPPPQAKSKARRASAQENNGRRQRSATAPVARRLGKATEAANTDDQHVRRSTRTNTGAAQAAAADTDSATDSEADIDVDVESVDESSQSLLLHKQEANWIVDVVGDGDDETDDDEDEEDEEEEEEDN